MNIKLISSLKRNSSVGTRRTMHKLAASLSLLLLALAGSADGSVSPHRFPALGADAPPPPLEFEVAAAERIGRFRIVAVHPTSAFAEDLSSRCGYRYSAVAVESLKGGREPLEFYSFYRDLDMGQDYLLFIHHNKAKRQEALTNLQDLLTSNEAIAISCRMSTLDYYLPVDRQTYFSFDLGASGRFGGEWLDGYKKGREMGFSWCQRSVETSGSTSPNKILGVREKVKGDASSLVFDWKRAKFFISRALGNLPHTHSGTLRSDFVPGQC